MKKSELEKLWRGFSRMGWITGHAVWVCGHCSAVVDDPEQHTRWHNDMRDVLQLIATAT